MRMPRTAARSGKLGKLLVYLPVVLEVLSLLRRSRQAQRGKYTRARRRDRALDFVLGRARRKLGSKVNPRRWF